MVNESVEVILKADTGAPKLLTSFPLNETAPVGNTTSVFDSIVYK